MNSSQADRRSAEQPLAGAIERLWRNCSAALYGITCEAFKNLLLDIAVAQHWGVEERDELTSAQQESFLESLKIEDLVLARACSAGNEKAWERFLIQYREMLYSAAYRITKQEAQGRDLADSLYADLFGTATRDGVRRSKLVSYAGRGSLAGWLRSVLAQRFVDEYRQARRNVSLEEQEEELVAALPQASSVVNDLPFRAISESVGGVLLKLDAEARFLLNAYYLDQRSLAQIAKLLGIHESTVSRKLHRITKELRKQLVKQLQRNGLSHGAAEEALAVDVRDLDIDVRKLLQAAGQAPFQEVKVSAGGNE